MPETQGARDVLLINLVERTFRKIETVSTSIIISTASYAGPLPAPAEDVQNYPTTVLDRIQVMVT